MSEHADLTAKVPFTIDPGIYITTGVGHAEPDGEFPGCQVTMTLPGQRLFFRFGDDAHNYAVDIVDIVAGMWDALTADSKGETE